MLAEKMTQQTSEGKYNPFERGMREEVGITSPISSTDSTFNFKSDIHLNSTPSVKTLIVSASKLPTFYECINVK